MNRSPHGPRLPPPHEFSVCLEVDLRQIRNNYRFIQSKCAVACGAVVKANGYGLGAVNISSALYQEGCKDFFVTSLDEAILLRNSNAFPKNINLYIFNGVTPNTEELFYQYNLIPVIISFGQIELWANFAKIKEKKLPAIIHIDTGISRTGLCPEYQKILCENPDILKAFEIKAIMSHLACANKENHPYNLVQLNRFKEFINFFPGYAYSLVGSVGSALGREYHFDLIRAGFGLYGSTKILPGCDLAARLWARIIQIRDIPKNTYVGYEAEYKSDTAKRLAVIGIGYADFWVHPNDKNLALSLHGKRISPLGRGSMDLLTVDISDFPKDEIKIGDWVQLLGPDISLQEAARLSQTTPAKILASLGGGRYHRIYYDDGISWRPSQTGRSG